MNLPLYYYSEALAVVFWLIFRKRFNNPYGKMVFVLLLVCFTIDVSAYLYSYLLQTSNHWIYNIYYPLLCILSSWLFYYKGENSKLLITVLIVFSLFALINNIIYPTDKLITINYLVGSLMVVIFSIRYLLRLLKIEPPVSLATIMHFWIVMANLLYFSSSSLYMGAINYLLTSDADGTYIKWLVYFPFAIFFILYSIAILCHRIPRSK
ncbi:MAG: hypothetical protein ACXWV5_03355 [Flavitalea sp.]